MSDLNSAIAGLELAQICWVVPDIRAAVQFLGTTLGVAGFPEPQSVRARVSGMTYYGDMVDGEWLTTQTYTGRSFIELVQPVSGQSMFHDYLARYPDGGTQHVAFRLPVSEFDRLSSDLRDRGYEVISEVDHPIARNGLLRHISDARRCDGDHGRHAGRLGGHSADAERPLRHP